MIAVRSLAKSYGERQVLSDVNLDLPAGGVIGLVGANGSGKSTLLSVIARLLGADAGTVEVGGLNVATAPGRQLATVLSVLKQDNHLAVRLTVRDLVGFGRYPHNRGRPTEHDETIVDQALEWMDLTELADRYLDEMSGGQRQRVLVARALAIRPAVLLLDEPFTGLDMPTQEMLMDLFRALADGGRALLMTTHDLIGARAGCDRLYLLRRTIIASGRPDELADADPWIRAFDVRPDNPILDALGVRA